MMNNLSLAIDEWIPMTWPTTWSPYKDRSFAIKKVIFNDPATIVYWMDGTKTVVKRWAEDESEFDKEKGLAMAFVKKALNNRENYKKDFRKWTK